MQGQCESCGFTYDTEIPLDREKTVVCIACLMRNYVNLTDGPGEQKAPVAAKGETKKLRKPKSATEPGAEPSAFRDDTVAPPESHE